MQYTIYSLAEEETSSGATETDCSTDYIWVCNVYSNNVIW